MPKKKGLEEIYYPVPTDFNLEKSNKPTINNAVIRQIIKGAVKGAHKLKNPSPYDYKGYPVKPKAVATQELESMCHEA